MLKNIDAIIFDLDGTLVDSMWMWKQIDIDFLAERGIAMPASLQRDIEGMSFMETAGYFIDTFHLTESLEELRVIWNDMAYKKYCNDITLKPGILDFLKYTKSKNIKLGIASSNSIELITAAIEHRGIKDYFNYVLSANDVARGKPFPDVYLEVAARLNVEPSKCLVFEDIPVGIMAGKAAGMKVYAVDDDYSMDQVEEKKALADYYLYSYDEIR